MFVIRTYQEDDFDTLIQIHKETVLTINASDYSAQQVEAWANKSPEDITSWHQALANSYTAVAESQGRLVGFANLFIEQGYVDRLYVHKDFQRKGIARALYMTLEEQAVKANLQTLTVEAAITSRPFFEKMGFVMISEQEKKVKNTSLLNYVMTKTLTSEDV